MTNSTATCVYSEHLFQSPIADLELILSWLDISRYLERFVQAGFESWETVLEIRANDLEASQYNGSTL